MTRTKTVSKVYYDDEIRGVFPDGSLYLKDGVKRNPLMSLSKSTEEVDEHINYALRNEDFIRKVKAMEQDESYD